MAQSSGTADQSAGNSQLDTASDQQADITNDERRIKPFCRLLSELSMELMDHEIQQALLLCSHQGIPSDKLRTDVSAVELLKTLDEYGIIGEDNTEFLKQVLEAASCVVGKTYVEEYEKERQEHLKNVEIMLGRRDPFFVGRTAFVSKILQVFRDDGHSKCRCVLVYGLAGTGKTKLAAESCAVYKHVSSGTRLPYVDLRKATRMEEAGLWILNTVTEKQISQGEFKLELVEKWIQKCSQDTILLLDNADEILSPSSYSRDHFINTLTNLISIENQLVKLLLTSRHPVDFQGLKDVPNFKEIKLEPLQVHESLCLLNKMVSHAQGSYGAVSVSREALRDEKSLIEIAKLCGNNPQALRAVASRLCSGFRPKSLVKALKKPKFAHRVLDPGSLGASAAVQHERKDFEDQPLVLSSIDAMYEQLSTPLKESLLRLSVFPSSFSLTQGIRILGKDLQDEAKFDLEDLKKWSLLDRELFDILDTGLTEDEPYYNVHPLVRSVCLTKIGTNALYRRAYEDTLRRFHSYVADLLKDLTKLGHKDFSKALARFEVDKTNVLHYLELDMGSKFGCEVNSNQKEDSVFPARLPEAREGLFSIFETFLDPSKRQEYYENMGRKMQRRGETLAWAYLQGWVGDELVLKAKYDEAWETVEGPLRDLETRRSETGVTNDLERAVAQLTYVKGRILVARRQYRDAIATFEKALSMQQRLLGNHSLTGRCLNALGHAYFNKADENRHLSGADKALEYHRLAWEMLVEITGNKPENHFDAPMYLVNIGASYNLMGKKWKRSDKKKAESFFRLAIDNYKEAHELERALRLSHFPNTASVLKNMAMSYCEMEEYEEALQLAIDAYTIRKNSKVFEVHPTTARNLFFIGSLYDSLGDKHKKLKNPDESVKNYRLALEYYNRAFQMEVKLGPSNHSIEYEDLKEDLAKLLKKLHMDKELEKYRRMFKQADEGSTNPGEVASLLSSSGGSPLRKRRHSEAMGAEDESPEGGGRVDETAGPIKRRAPGPVFADDNPDEGIISLFMRWALHFLHTVWRGLFSAAR